MTLATVLPVLWFGVIGFGVLMYVLLDGFVLGLGILAPFAEDEHQLDHMSGDARPILMTSKSSTAFCCLKSLSRSFI